jgi:hypothetical protein
MLDLLDFGLEFRDAEQARLERREFARLDNAVLLPLLLISYQKCTMLNIMSLPWSRLT